MAKLYGEKNDFPNQVLYLQKSNALQNDLNERNKNGFQELREVLYETNKISNASQNNPNDKINYWILSVIVLLPSCYFGYRFNKNRKKLPKIVFR